MRGSLRLALVATVFAALFAVPGNALALTTTNPANLSFVTQQLGTTSSAQTVTLKVNCDSVTVPPLCTTPVVFAPAISTTGDFTQTNNCPPVMTAVTSPGVSCTISVQFTPSMGGTRSGTLSVGGPVVSLSGLGGVLGNGAGGGGGPVAANLPSLLGIPGGGTNSRPSGKCVRKKKHRHHAAAAASQRCKRH